MESPEALPRQEPASQPAFIRRYRFVVAALVFLAHFALGMNLFAASPIMPLVIEEYSINRTTAGLLVTLALLFAAGFGLPGGVIISRIGVRRAFTIGWWLVALMALAVVTPNFAVLLVVRLAYGVGAALILTATGPLLMRWFQPKEVLIMNGINTASLSLGIAISVSTAAPLADVVGWLEALSIFAIVGVVGAVAWMFLSGPVEDASPPVPMISRQEVWSVLTNRTVLLLVAADAGVLIQYSALSSWLPSFYHEVRGLSLSEAGFITGLLPLIGVLGVLAGAVLPYRFESKRSFLIIPGLMVVVGGPVAFLVGNIAGIYLAVLLVGIGSWLYVPTLLSTPMELPGMTPEKVAIVWGSFITFSGFAMFIAPLLVGGLRDLLGSFEPGFAICAAGAWTLLLAGLFLPKMPPRVDAA